MYRYLISLFFILATLAVCGQNYPDVYLRGEVNGWQARADYRFNRIGDVYTLSLSALDGEFKIADANWGEVDFGGAVSGVTIGHDNEYELVKRGRNLRADNMRDVTISFILTPGAETLMIYTDREPVRDPERPVAGLSGTLPVLYVNVYTDETLTAFDDEITSMNLSHKNYFTNARYWLDTNGCAWLEELGAVNVGSKEEPLPLQIKARGNWTRKGFAKKPFKLKLDSKASLLGMSKSKHYALLAHADDNFGYLRNFTGFELGKRIGLPWTPSQQPVELVINGRYHGLYFLTESIRVEKERIAIESLDDNCTDATLASGGYLVELDNYDEENQIRMEEKSCVPGLYTSPLRITFDTPEEYSDLQRRFISDQFTAINDAVGSNSDETWRYMDIDDAARYYIVEEIISHVESYHGSTYLFRDRGETQKWHFSPLWDCGNAFVGPVDDYFYNRSPFGNTWIPSMRCNSKFNEKVRETWLWFMSERYDGLTDAITEYTSHLKEAARADHHRWDGQPYPDGGREVADNSDMESRRNVVLAHLKAKTEWLKGAFGDYSSASYPEPARDTTEAVPLPDYLSGVDDVTADNSGSAPRYFNLQGIEITDPTTDGVVIEVRGRSARKIVFSSVRP